MLFLKIEYISNFAYHNAILDLKMHSGLHSLECIMFLKNTL